MVWNNLQLERFVNSPASLALLHAWYMSSLISGFPSAIVSPTVTNLSTARFTACPTLATARRLLSEHSGRSLCDTNVEIWKKGGDELKIGKSIFVRRWIRGRWFFSEMNLIFHLIHFVCDNCYSILKNVLLKLIS